MIRDSYDLPPNEYEGAIYITEERRNDRNKSSFKEIWLTFGCK